MTLFRPMILIVVLMIAAPAWADGFLSGSDDVPLAPGLTEITGSGLVFDTPQGRIVEAYAQGPVASAAVLGFYAQALPQLGWTRQSDGRYRRDDEILGIEVTAESRGLSVHFTLSPE